MTLRDCVAYALQHSPELEKLGIDHENQRLQTLIARATFALDLGYGADYRVDDKQDGNTVTLSKEFPQGFDVTTSLNATENHADGQDSASFSVKLSKQILGGGTALETQQALDDSVIDEAVALNRINRRKRELVFRVKQAFYQIISEVQSKSIQERRLERSQRNLEHAVEREKPLDIITARIQIPENRLAVLRVERAIQTGINSMKVLIGLPVEQPLKLAEEFEFRLADYDLAKDSAFAVENHEDFLNNRLEAEKLKRAAEIARDHLWPDVSVSATHQTQSTEDGINLDGEHEQILALEFSWELGRGTDRASFRQAGNRVRRQDVDLFILKQKKLQRLQELDRLLQENAESIRLQEERVRLVSRQVELYADRWENGEIDILEFIRSQNDLENSKVELLRLQGRYMQLLADYEFEVGR